MEAAQARLAPLHSLWQFLALSGLSGRLGVTTSQDAGVKRFLEAHGQLTHQREAEIS
jgi:hypothetical protein